MTKSKRGHHGWQRRGPTVWVVCSRRGFQAKVTGRRRALTGVVTQQVAIGVARRFARRHRSELIVQARSGRIRIKDNNHFLELP
jgi:hypothetical protein